jgi:hypothetical protein
MAVLQIADTALGPNITVAEARAWIEAVPRHHPVLLVLSLVSESERCDRDQARGDAFPSAPPQKAPWSAATSGALLAAQGRKRAIEKHQKRLAAAAASQPGGRRLATKGATGATPTSADGGGGDGGGGAAAAATERTADLQPGLGWIPESISRDGSDRYLVWAHLAEGPVGGPFLHNHIEREDAAALAAGSGARRRVIRLVGLFPCLSYCLARFASSPFLPS